MNQILTFLLEVVRKFLAIYRFIILSQNSINSVVSVLSSSISYISINTTVFFIFILANNSNVQSQVSIFSAPLKD